MQIIDGKKIANDVLAEIKREIKEESARGGPDSVRKTKPCLAIVLVGDDPSSILYIKMKEKAATQIGVKIEKFFLPKESSKDEILKAIKELNSNLNIDGILIQLPLPKGINPDRIIKKINPEKNVDGFLSDSRFESPFISAIWQALVATGEDLNKKKDSCLS